MFGPDVVASITTSELEQLVRGVRFIERMRSTELDKDAMAGELAPLRSLFTKSVVARVDLVAGTKLAREHLAAKKPGTGIPAARLDALIGRRLRRAVAADALLSESDLEELP
jgi:N-acetylneuraminate synthase